jgi:PAS domain S-box-containing protein
VLTDKTKIDLLAEIDVLKTRLIEAEENLNAIRCGGVDALVISGPQGEQVFTLNDADRPYRIIIEEMNEGTVTTNSEGIVLYSNKQFAKMLKIPLSKLIGTSIFEYVRPQDCRILEKLISRKMRSSGKAEVGFDRNDGTNVWTNVSFSPLYIDHTPVFCGVITDVTVLKNAQKALQESEKRFRTSEERYRLLAENANDIIFTMDMNLRFTYISPSIKRIRGYTVEEAMSQTLAEALTPASLEVAINIFQKELEIEAGEAKDLYRTRTIELEETCKNGSFIWTETTFSPFRDEKNKFTGILGITRDITERRRTAEEKKKFESQLMQLQKMEAMGRFAGGIAHDLNNILFPIIIDTEFLLEKTAPDTSMHQILSEVLSAAYRQKELVKQILTFSRKNEQQLSPIKITPLIKEALTFLKASLPSSIKIHLHIDVEADIILGDSTQIHQIIMNLCKNAADALESQKGTIEMKLVNAYLKPTSAYPGIKPGQYLQLSVRDTGCGIPTEILDRIFEPFFTTKELGRGSGMGLAVVHGIIKRHGGTITVESEPGKGSQFNVYLPENDGIPLNPPLGKDRNRSVKGKEKILLVDDEEIVLSSLQRALKRTGYDIIAVSDGLEALNMFSKTPDKFDLVITDMTMPRITGVELAKKLMNVRSDIPIILCTGYSDVINEQEAKALGIREMLLKPSTINDLNTVVRRALEN